MGGAGDAGSGVGIRADGGSSCRQTGDYTAAQVGAEPALGNPATNGYVLSSTTAGVRSWVAQSGGSGGGLTPVVLSAAAMGQPNSSHPVSGGATFALATNGASYASWSFAAAAQSGAAGMRFVDIPGSAVNLNLVLDHEPASTVGASSVTLNFSLRWRQMSAGNAWGAWQTLNIPTITLAASAQYLQETTYTLTLATAGMTAGTKIRVTGAGEFGDMNLCGDGE